jgi:hypothetical protein
VIARLRKALDLATAIGVVACGPSATDYRGRSPADEHRHRLLALREEFGL